MDEKIACVFAAGGLAIDEFAVKIGEADSSKAIFVAKVSLLRTAIPVSANWHGLSLGASAIWLTPCSDIPWQLASSLELAPRCKHSVLAHMGIQSGPTTIVSASKHAIAAPPLS